MFVAHFQLALVLVGFHEEALFDVKQHGEVLEQPRLLGRHLDMRERPRRRPQLALEVEKLVAVGPGTQDSCVRAHLSAVFCLHALDVAVLDHQLRDVRHDELGAQSLRLGRATHQRFARVNPPGARGLVQALPGREVSRQHALGHGLSERLGVFELHKLLVDVRSLAVVELLQPILRACRHNVPRVMIVGGEDRVRGPPLRRGGEECFGHPRLVVAVGELSLLDDLVDIVSRGDGRRHGVRVDECDVRVPAPREVQGRAAAPCPSSYDQD